MDSSSTSPHPSLVRRFFDLFAAPSRAFVAPRPGSMWLVGLLVVCLFQIADSALLQNLYDQKQLETTQKILDRNERLSAAQKDKMIQEMEDRAGTTKNIVVSAVARVVAVGLLGVLLPAGLLLFGVNFVFGGKARFIDVLHVVTFSQLVTVPRDLILIPLRAATQNLEIYAGPASLVSSEGSLLQPVLMLFDVFELYHLVPLALGLAVVGAITRGKAWGLVIALFSIWALIALGFSWMAIKMGAM